MKAHAVQIGVSFAVGLFSGLLVVLCTVNFNDQLGLSTIKVNNVTSNHFLSVYRHR